jgi:hypothetical protein
MPHVGDEERRRRIGVRHRLAPGARASSLREAAAAMVALHATDPAGLLGELEPVDGGTAGMIDAEAARLAAWLGPTRIRWPFPPP